VSGGRETATVDSETMIVAVAIEVVLRTVVRVRVDRKTVVHRRVVALVVGSVVVAGSVAHPVLAGQCRDLHRQVDRWRVHRITSKAQARSMRGSRD
jgi:hypothetical protein